MTGRQIAFHFIIQGQEIIEKIYLISINSDNRKKQKTKNKTVPVFSKMIRKKHDESGGKDGGL